MFIMQVFFKPALRCFIFRVEKSFYSLIILIQDQIHEKDSGLCCLSLLCAEGLIDGVYSETNS